MIKVFFDDNARVSLGNCRFNENVFLPGRLGRYGLAPSYVRGRDISIASTGR